MTDAAGVRVRPLVAGDLDEADRIFRVAFGTFLGVPEPEGSFGDTDMVRTRWRADPGAALAAELGGRLALDGPRADPDDQRTVAFPAHPGPGRAGPYPDGNPHGTSLPSGRTRTPAASVTAVPLTSPIGHYRHGRRPARARRSGGPPRRTRPS